MQRQACLHECRRNRLLCVMKIHTCTSHTHAHTSTSPHTRACAYKHAHTYTYPHICVRAYKHAHTHIHTHIYTQALAEAGDRLRAIELSESEAQERIQELLQQIQTEPDSTAVSLQVRYVCVFWWDTDRTREHVCESAGVFRV